MANEATMDVQARKRAVRTAALARRDALTVDERRERSAAIGRHVESLAQYRAAHCVMAYAGFGSEIDTLPLLRAVLAAGKALVLPRVDGPSGRLQLFQIGDIEADTAAGVWGIREPVPQRASRVEPDRLDLVLVPGVAFDRRGGRVGYGKGFYDKLLASCRAAGRVVPTVAAAFETQVVDAVPMEPHDVRMDTLVTEVGACPITTTLTGVPLERAGTEFQPERREAGDAARAASQ